MEQKVGYKDIFHQKEYMKMILAALVNRFGDSIDAIAAAWIVYELTGSASWSAIIYAVNKVPTVVITPLAGAWVEGRNKKRILVMTDIIRAVCVAVVATGYLMGFLTPWILVLTNFTISTAEAFRGPANMAVLPKVLDKKYYDYGISLMSTLCSIMELIGTALAAGIIALIGTAGAIYVDMVTFLLSASIIMFVNTKEEKTQKQKFEAKAYAATLKEGMGYVFKNKMLAFFIFLATFMNAILIPLESLQAPMANELLHGGAEVLSILSVALTMGMLLGSVLYPTIRGKLTARIAIGFAGSLIGVYYLVMVACQPIQNQVVIYGIVAIFSIIFGFSVAILNTYINVEFMRVIEEEYLARSSAFMSAVAQAALPVVSFVIGIVALYVSTTWLFVISAVIDFIVIFAVVRNSLLDVKAPEASEAEEKETDCAVVG